MKEIHGGDIYRNHVKLDFSVNINPFEMPEAVKEVLYEAVENCDRYPDPACERLKKAVGRMLDVSSQNLLFGNGSSELFMALIHAVRPKKTVIPVPSFYGYEYAAGAADGEILYYETKQEHDFGLQEDFFSALTEDVDLLFLANPNNPTGKLMSREGLRKVLWHCREKGIYVVLDECFIEFCYKEASMLQEIEAFPNLILVRAFTKIFAIPGVRLGYLVCSDPLLLGKISRQLPEWNVSVFAQAAGCGCAAQTVFIEKTAAFIEKERQFLESGLRQAGYKVFSGKANFLLVYSKQPLYDRLLEKGILIRDCENFRGLSKGFYRIAVKSRKENEILLEAIKEITENPKRKIEYLLPDEIEKKSFEIIAEEFKKRGITLPAEQEMVTKRVIHTSADFDYANTLEYSKDAVLIAKELLKNGADIVTDTNMALSGINKNALAKLGGQAHCFMADNDVARIAKERGITRAAASMEKAAGIEKTVVFAVGNAPTALIRLYEMIQDGSFRPAFIIGVPVGFVNVVAAKELIMQTGVPYIINRGRKGGSNVAAAICNALLYELTRIF